MEQGFSRIDTDDVNFHDVLLVFHRPSDNAASKPIPGAAENQFRFPVVGPRAFLVQPTSNCPRRTIPLAFSKLEPLENRSAGGSTGGEAGFLAIIARDSPGLPDHPWQRQPAHRRQQNVKSNVPVLQHDESRRFIVALFALSCLSP